MNKVTIKDIENVSFDILKQSKSLGVFPTPVDKIVEFCELKVDRETCLSKIPNNYLSKFSETLKSALRKVRGAIDTREKIIRLDLTQPIGRQKFVQLHETGHNALPWQRKTFEYYDDDDTLSPDVKIAFEAEANFFASGTLFQLDRFDEEASQLELTIRSPLALSKQFGGSIHATLRRYVERSPKRCALLVIEKEGLLNFKVRSYFQSPTFTTEFGTLKWPERLGPDQAFIADCSLSRKMKVDGQFLYKGENGDITFQYHFFNNSFNYFVMVLPFGEKIKSKVKLVVRE